VLKAKEGRLGALVARFFGDAQAHLAVHSGCEMGRTPAAAWRLRG
jgi:hypothetical protein